MERDPAGRGYWEQLATRWTPGARSAQGSSCKRCGELVGCDVHCAWASLPPRGSFVGLLPLPGATWGLVEPPG
eukprot:1584167-Pyramimonas_sp.AAC.1